ncbi:hypothetical protein D6U52_17295 [Vibrio cholerae]|nr:hypothetical protein [Vibrio cholerae]
MKLNNQIEKIRMGYPVVRFKEPNPYPLIGYVSNNNKMIYYSNSVRVVDKLLNDLLMAKNDR